MRHTLLRPLAAALLVATPMTGLAADDAPTTRVEGPGDVLPTRSWDATHLELDVRVDPVARTVSGVATWRVTPTGLPGTPLHLDAVGLDLGEVTVDGAPAKPSVATGGLALALPAGDHVVRVPFTGRPETGMHFRGPRDSASSGPQAWSQGEGEDNRHWYPGPDYPSDTFTVDLRVEAPDGLSVIANGVRGPTERSAPGWTAHRFSLAQPLVNYLVAVSVGPWSLTTLPGPVPLEVATDRSLRPDTVARSFARTDEMMTFFQGLLDEPYPFPIYRQVVVDRFLYGGMENSSATTLSADLLAMPEEIDAVSSRRVIAHELAHQWFGDLLFTRGWRELWLNEGFAEAYAARWMEHGSGPEAYADQVISWHEAALGAHHPMAPRSWSHTGRDNHAVYTRGATVLHALRVLLGEERYDAAIAAWIDAHRGELVETDQLRRVVEDAAGMHLGWLFDRYVHRPGSPRLVTTWRVRADTLTVQLAQEDEHGGWRGPARVMWGAGDAVHEQTVWLDADGGALHTPTRGEVTWVFVDPEGGVPARFERKQPTAAWAATLAEAPTAFARAVAVRALGDHPDDPAVAIEALDGALRGWRRVGDKPAPDDDPWSLEVAAARALGSVGTPEARDALIGALDEVAPRVRAAALGALAKFPLDEAVVREVIRRADGAEAPTVRAAALAALADLQPSAALTRARAWLAKPDPTFDGALHAAAAHALRDHGQPSDLPALARGLTDVRRAVQHAAGTASVALGAQATDAARDALADRLQPWLTHADLRTRQLGVALLGELRAPKSEAWLDQIARTTTLPDLAADARDAAREVAAGRPDAEDPDAVAKLRKELDQLTERLEALERAAQDPEAPTP